MASWLIALLGTAGATAVSRVLGMIRDMIFASTLGSSPWMDAFLVAFRIPNMLRRLVAEGAFSQSFMPSLAQKVPADERELFIGQVAVGLALISGLIVLWMFCAAPSWVAFFAPGFLDEPLRYETAVRLLRITSVYTFCMAWVAWASALLNYERRFIWPAWSAVLLNLCLIAAAVHQVPLSERVEGLAWAVLIAGLLQGLWVSLPLMRYRRWRFAWQRLPLTMRFLKMLGPALLSSGAHQVHAFLESILLSFLIAGSVSHFYYADRLLEFPIGVFSVALSTIFLVSSAQVFARSPTAYEAHWHRALFLSWAMAIPSALGLWALSRPLVIVLFARGQFDTHAVEQTAMLIQILSWGLPASMLYKMVLNDYLVHGDTRTPLKITVIGLACHAFLGGAWVTFFAWSSYGSYGMGVLQVFSNLLQIGLLIWPLRARLQAWTWRWAGHCLWAAILMGVSCRALAQCFPWGQMGLAAQLLALVLITLLGVGLYFLCIRTFGIPWRALLKEKPLS